MIVIPNQAMLYAHWLFFSDDEKAKIEVERHELRRFDTFINDPEYDITGFLSCNLEAELDVPESEHTYYEDTQRLITAFNNVHRHGDFYAGMWDTDRQLGLGTTTKPLPDQPNRMPRSSTQQLPAQRHRPQASA